MAITVEQANEYLASQGVTLPSFVVEAFVEQVNSIEECLIENGVLPATAMLIQLYLLGLMGLAQTYRYISSQTAPSGASRSFRFADFGQIWRGIYGSLSMLDKYGCATGLIPEDPSAVPSFGGMMTFRGSGMCEK